MRTEIEEQQTIIMGRMARVTDAKGRVVLKVHECFTFGESRGFYAGGELLNHIDGDSLAIRKLSADTLPAAVIEARALVVRELAAHATRIAEAAKEFTHDPDLSRRDGADEDVRQAVVAVDSVAGPPV